MSIIHNVSRNSSLTNQNMFKCYKPFGHLLSSDDGVIITVAACIMTV